MKYALGVQREYDRITEEPRSRLPHTGWLGPPYPLLPGSGSALVARVANKAGCPEVVAGGLRGMGSCCIPVGGGVRRVSNGRAR